ncbi:MAG: leader peptidase (prepilin peptidase) / N-methyltransferase [Solirubrobacteraceae bacterium]|jgi:leader peptidase (prepilin peptidase)/N-methyltransferase|nr:leader peptidase (prepilin peptidase) / N-methyltransferase [Solirubrobacteraceae bacterium]MEA2138881.1 leader peptidase (prepilin peptidase) / N-methyltransferase [Solirubrobacteraceae bacterium]
MPIVLLPAAAFGLIIGSFLNVVAYRLPRHESLSTPGSHCPSCDAPIKPYDNVPLLSWMLLRGRCRGCKAAIAPRYPLIEGLTAILFAAVVAVHLHDTAMLVLGLVLVAFLVPIALIDAETRKIPNSLTAPAAVLALVVGTALDPGGEVERLIAAAAAGGVLMLPSLLHPAGMGMGDAKLVGVLGLYLGRGVAPAFLVAFAVGTVVGVAIMLRKGLHEGRKTALPFGPFLALGGLVGLLAGDALVELYLDTF